MRDVQFSILAQVLKNPDMERESNRDDKENKDDRDKLSPKDPKNRSKRDDKVREKSTRDRETKPIIKGYRDRVDERNKDREIKQRRYDEKKLYGRRDESGKDDKRIDLKDDRRYEVKEDRKVEEKRGKSYEKMRQEKKKLAETKKQMADANVSEASPKKVKEEHDNVQEIEDAGGDAREFTRDDDDLKHVKDNERVQRNAAEDRVTIEDASENRRDAAERGNSVDNAGEYNLISLTHLTKEMRRES